MSPRGFWLLLPPPIEFASPTLYRLNQTARRTQRGALSLSLSLSLIDQIAFRISLSNLRYFYV
jgi:hypothetical protein